MLQNLVIYSLFTIDTNPKLTPEQNRKIWLAAQQLRELKKKYAVKNSQVDNDVNRLEKDELSDSFRSTTEDNDKFHK
ncbi:MAG: hypothetical protein WCP85_12645 [Mariniphaga sp.]